MTLTQREKKIAEIIIALREEFDVEKVEKIFVEEVGKYLDADTVCFFFYDPVGKKLLTADDFIEYRKSPDAPSLRGINLEELDFLKKFVKKNKY